MEQPSQFSQGLTGLATSIARAAWSGAAKAYDLIVDDHSIHLKSAYDRCSKLRTLFSRDRSISLWDVFVPTDFEFRDTKYSTSDLHIFLESNKKVVLIGTGGGGKTLSLKHLWLTLFQHPDGRIPIFIELRNFNDIELVDFEAWLYHSIVVQRPKYTIDNFRAAMRGGRYVLVLDGFDELVDARRAAVESYLVQLGRSSQSARIIVSSRRDDRFAAWQSFVVAKVSPLTKNQVVQIAKKIPFEPSVTKKKFISRLEGGEMDSHLQFLQTPLLVVLMLLTYDQFADVPEKVYLFYEQVFDTLYARHDAIKEVYRRNIHCGLPIDQFKRALSVFCASSYHEGVYEFSNTALIEYARSAEHMVDFSFDPVLFIRDLKESICILQEEGHGTFGFSHRSLQEFFTAYFLRESIDEPEAVSEIGREILRNEDSKVLSMFYDMKPSACTKLLLKPVLREALSFLDSKRYFGYEAHWYVSLRVATLMIRTSPGQRGGPSEPQIILLSAGTYAGLFRLLEEKFPEMGSLNKLLLFSPALNNRATNSTNGERSILRLYFTGEKESDNDRNSRFSDFPSIYLSESDIDFDMVRPRLVKLRTQLNRISLELDQLVNQERVRFRALFSPRDRGQK